MIQAPYMTKTSLEFDGCYSHSQQIAWGLEGTNFSSGGPVCILAQPPLATPFAANRRPQLELSLKLCHSGPKSGTAW